MWHNQLTRILRTRLFGHAELIEQIVGAELSAETAGPTTVVVVRHADRDGQLDKLTAAGTLRARALAEALAGAGISRILTSDTERAWLTADPVQATTGAMVEITAYKGVPLDQHVDAVVAKIHAISGGSVLVIGHTDSVPKIVSRLGGPESLRDICFATFSRIFILHRRPPPVRTVEARYGANESACGPGN